MKKFYQTCKILNELKFKRHRFFNPLKKSENFKKLKQQKKINNQPKSLSQSPII